MHIFKKRSKRDTTESKAVVLLKTVREGILAEKALVKNGYTARKVAPPPTYRKGCEIAVEIELSKKDEVTKILNDYNIETQGIIPL